MESKEAEKYNGWTNYETWVVCLWLDNEESSYRYWRAEAERHRQDADEPNEAVNNFAAQLKDELEEATPTDAPNVYSDLLNAALSAVNWHEIAEHLLVED
jgi:hypothetical protein